MVAGKIQHWKHGWIPVSPEAKAFIAGAGPNPSNPSGRPPDALSQPGFDDLSPSLQAKINAKMSALTGMSEPKLAARVQTNLIASYQHGDRRQADWYYREGSDIARRASAVGLTQEQLTGMISVTSTKKRWQENKDFAQRIGQKLKDDQPFAVTPAMIGDYNTWVGKRRGGLAVIHPDLKPGTYKPSQLPADFAASKTPGMPKHLNADYVIAAVQIARDEKTLDQAVTGPKHRSFVNNLTDPADKRFVTVDTWHYRAAMTGIKVKGQVKGHPYNYTLEQWTDRDLSVKDGRAALYGYDPKKDRYDPANIKATILAADAKNPQGFFQAGPSSVADHFNDGTYPWFVKQTQIAADRIGVSPNALQAVAWYAVGGGE